jgi:oligopeptide transport system permease protein
MLRFILRRLLIMVPTLFVIMTLSWVLIRSAPGSALDRERPLPPEVRKNVEAHFGLDKPLWQQYAIYMGRLFHGDLGPSLTLNDRSVNEVVASGLPVSLSLAVVALVLALVLGMVAGLVGAIFRGQWPDKVLMGLAIGGLCVPNFVLAPLLVLIFALTLQWLPAARFVSLRYMWLPAISLAALYVSYVARLVRAGLIETVRLDFVRTARAKGLSEAVVIGRHALPMGLLPVVSFIGPAAVGLITGSVVIEKYFGIPGLGRYFVDAAINRDDTMALGIVLVEAALLMVANLAVDLAYGLLDPRVRQAQASEA